MSFYCYKNGNPTATPGILAGDALAGLQEKVCVQVKRVYDSCMDSKPLKAIDVVFTQFALVPHPTHCHGGHGGHGNPGHNLTPEGGPVAPITFESCRSSTTKSEIRNLTVERLCDKPCFARVRAVVDLPIDILFSDALCNEYIGRAVISVEKDVMLSIPDESIVPYSIESMGSAVCVSGTYIGNNTFTMTVCVTIVLKVVADVEMLIPSYGFCSIPPCEDFAENVCEEFFSLPLFPPASLCNDCGKTACPTTPMPYYGYGCNCGGK
ncbi:MAG: hypothetical protein LBD16_01070 [Oscillospiraceae bacterium]|jgi:hypothetical protein|nr:hypothetical protein [Oscillospiraceae bacterium]